MKTSALRAWGVAGAFAAVVGIGAAGCQKHETAAQAKSIAWFTSYDAALADAGKSGRPILLDFYTDW